MRRPSVAPAPFETKPRRPERPIGAALGNFVPKVTKAAFARFGFPAAAILTDWPTIVGEDMARIASPERLRWARKAQDDDESDDESNRRPGATLVLRVDPSRALDIQYRSRQLVERINAYFGFRAVADLRIVQAPLDVNSKRVRPVRNQAPPLVMEGIGDPTLSAALARLGGNVRAQQTGK